MQSESVKNIVPALIKVQSEITNVAKNADNPFFKSKYADLPTIIEHSRHLLCENGLVIVQTNEPHDSGIVVVTTIYHSSGEWIQGKLRLTPTKNDPQQCGSAITYGRRYGLAAILNIAQEDDDGNLASKKQISPEPIRQEAVDAAHKAFKEVIDADVDVMDFERVQLGYSRLTNDERIAVATKFGTDKPEGCNKQYKSIVKELLAMKKEEFFDPNLLSGDK